MLVKIGEKKVNIKGIVTYIAVFYILILSGSVIHYSNMGTIGNINAVLTIIMLFVYCLYDKSVIGKIRKNIVDVFVVCGGIGLLISMTIWGNYSFFIGYFNTYCLILFPWLICKFIKCDEFMNAFIKIIYILAIVSLILYIFPILLTYWPFKIELNTSNWNYDYYIFYATFQNATEDILKRNIGIFWEPGMYQGYLIFAMLYVAVAKKMNTRKIVFQFIMFMTIATIQSSTGYILLLPIIFIFIISNVPSNWKRLRLITAMIVLLLILVLTIDPKILYSVFEKFAPDLVTKMQLENDGGSMATRFYSLLIDAYLAIRNPFGIGILQVDIYRKNIANLLGFIVDGSNINTTFTMMLYYGMIPGIMYLYMMIKGCFNYFKDKIIIILAIAIFLVIINTEPHYMTMFFTTIFMYFAQSNQIHSCGE